jgi:four helix bundle protein
MKKVERFEDLIAWQKARVLAQTVYMMTRDRIFAKDIGLSNQVQRAAVSVMANIAEGFERNRPVEFHQFLSVAKGSCAEVLFHLYAAHDASVAGQKKPPMRNGAFSPTQHSAPSTQHL